MSNSSVTNSTFARVNRTRRALFEPVYCLIAAGFFVSASLGGSRAVCTAPAGCEVTKLTAIDSAPFRNYGRNVAVSGSVAIVGAPGTVGQHDTLGSAYIYRFDGSQWIHEAILMADDETLENDFGIYVSIDGDVAVVGALYAPDCSTGPGCGAAYVFRFNGTSWFQEQKFFATGFARVSGDWIIFSLFPVYNGENDDYTYFYQYDGSTWVEKQAVLSVGDPHIPAPHCTAIKGNLAFAGKGRNLYRYDGAQWNLEFTFDPAHEISSNGCPIAFGENMIAFGGAFEDCSFGDNCGKVFVYEHDGDSWNLQATLTGSDTNQNDQFGINVAFAGGRLVIAASEKECDFGNVCGTAYVFRQDGDAWAEESKLTPSSPGSFDAFGRSMSSDGMNVILGAYNGFCLGGIACGEAYIFSFDDTDADCNGRADVCEARGCQLYGDVFPTGYAVGDCKVDLDDILCALAGFAQPSACPDANVMPCGGDAAIDVDDILAVVAAFGGNYSCPHPIPP